MNKEEFLELRERYKQILQENEYGYIPEKPISVVGEVKSANERFCAGKATLEKIELKAMTKNGEVVFPFTYVYAGGKKKQRTVICINFRPDVPDMYIPAEEIVDRGWAFVSLCYKDVTGDNGDINDTARILGYRTSLTAPGKIAIWAWAAMRVLDYLSTRQECDPTRTGVAGHSRLGKTALVTAAFDERFAFSHSNCSGSGGAALFGMRNKESEPIETLNRVFPFWFCENFKKFNDKEYELPFDQHYLEALIAPRYLSVASAVEDLWANPAAEAACAEKASFAWEAFGKKGLKMPDGGATAGEVYGDGNVLYSLRKGLHYFSREDWNKLLTFLDGRL